VNHFFKIGGIVSLLIGIAANIWFMFQNGEPNRLYWYFIATPFLFWTFLPFAAVYLIIYKANELLYTRIIFFFTSATISFGGFWILYDAFVLNLDPQSGLVFLILPFLQLIVVSIGFGLIQLLRWKISSS